MAFAATARAMEPAWPAAARKPARRTERALMLQQAPILTRNAARARATGTGRVINDKAVKSRISPQSHGGHGGNPLKLLNFFSVSLCLRGSF